MRYSEGGVSHRDRSGEIDANILKKASRAPWFFHVFSSKLICAVVLILNHSRVWSCLGVAWRCLEVHCNPWESALAMQSFSASPVQHLGTLWDPWDFNWVVYIIGGTPIAGWFLVENSIKMDDLGVPLFQESSISRPIFSDCALVRP